MRFTFLILSWFALASLAAAEISNDTISAYNKALSAGTNLSEIEATAYNLASEAITDPDHQDAGLLAFEAAWTLCRINQCAKGAEAAKFAVGQTVRSNGIDPSREMREVLISFIDWKTDDSNRNRKELTERLANLAPDDVSQVSLTAHREHFIYCSNKGAWKDAAIAAEAAVKHAAMFKEELFNDYALAELTRVVSGFNSRPKVDQYRDILLLIRDIEATLVERKEISETVALDSPLFTLMNRATVWSGAIGAYLSTSGKKRRIVSLREEYPPLPAFTEDRTDFCKGGFQTPPILSYPEDALSDLRYGSVLVGFDVENGETTNVRVLASVPEDVFDEEAIRAVDALTWSFAEGVDTSQCSMVRRNIRYPIVFQIR